MPSEFGAPILKNEIKEIEDNLESVLNYLPEHSRDAISRYGIWESKKEQLLLKSIDNKDCIFVYRENGIAYCGIEKAYSEGKSTFRKPLSCHLFPIRINDFGGDILHYEKYEECKSAVQHGENLSLTVAEFCEDALVRAYSKEWYDKLKSHMGKS